MTLSEFLSRYLEMNRLSYRDFAKSCGDVSFQYIQMIAKGVNPQNGKPIKPSLAKLNSIAKAMGLTIDELMAKVDDLEVNISAPLREPNFQRVPIIGKCAAGEPVYDEFTDEYIDSRMNADCALVVEGDSMEPTFLDGDIVYVHRTPDVEYEGQIGIVIVEDEATIKHIYHIKNGLLLISDNPKYAPMQKTLDEYSVIRILGTVCGYTRMFRK